MPPGSKICNDTSPDVLVVLAHHDDEFFLSGAISVACAAGKRVVAAYLTHGSAYGADAHQRIEESQSVLSKLGVEPQDVYQIGLERGIFDAKLCSHLAAASEALDELAHKYCFAEAYVLAWEGGHHDHDCAHYLGVRLARAAGLPVMEASAYNGYRCIGSLFKVMSFIPAQSARIRLPVTLGQRIRLLMLAFYYRSQLMTFMGLMPGILWRLFPGGGFEIRVVPPFDYDRPPHEGRLFYETRFNFRFETLQGAIQELEYRSKVPVSTIS